MNILFVNGSSDLYGSSRILSIVIEKLSANHNVYLILPEYGPLVDLLEEEKINVKIFYIKELPVIARRFNSVKGLVQTFINFSKTFFIIKKIVREHNITLGYANTSACLFIVKIFNILKIKSVLHFHEILEKPKKVVTILNRWAVQWPNQIIAVSHAVKDNLLYYNEEEKSISKISVIYNGIEDKSLYVEKPIFPIIITLIGRITEAKGIWFFLDAIALLKPELIEKCSFRILGGAAPGKELLIEKLDKDIKNHIYGKQIKHYDFVQNVQHYLNETDILVVPSLMTDPFPTTILEGLSAGKPVIASNAGGATESIVDSVSGFLIERGDTVEFAATLKKLIEDEKLRSEIGNGARLRFEENYKVEIFEKKINDFITGL